MEERAPIARLLVVAERVAGDGANGIIDEINEFFKNVALEMVAHMKSAALNLEVPTYIAQCMVSLDPVHAQKAARQFQHRLTTTSRDRMYAFERAFCDDEQLLEQLNIFCEISPPCLLWRCAGACRELFIFMAVIFYRTLAMIAIRSRCTRPGNGS